MLAGSLRTTIAGNTGISEGAGDVTLWFVIGLLEFEPVAGPSGACCIFWMASTKRLIAADSFSKDSEGTVDGRGTVDCCICDPAELTKWVLLVVTVPLLACIRSITLEPSSVFGAGFDPDRVAVEPRFGSVPGDCFVAFKV